MSPKKQILSEIKKNTKILRNCQVRAKRYSESLISEARSGGQEQEQAIRTKFKNQKSKAIQDKKEHLGQVKSEYEKKNDNRETVIRQPNKNDRRGNQRPDFCSLVGVGLY